MALAFLAGAPAPINDPVVNEQRLATQPWIEHWNTTTQILEAAPLVVNNVTVEAQTASIGATDFSGGAIAAGLYRLNYYARITTAAGTSSSLTVTFSWTDDGVPQSLSAAAMTGNTTTTVQGTILVIHSDANTPIRFATTYASSGVPAMTYKLLVVLEELAA